jgi:Tol biopolymer transport system component
MDHNGRQQRGKCEAVYFFRGSRAWSPDGKWIAFTSNRERGYAVYLRRAIGGPAIRVTAPASADKNHPSWTPDGKTIMFEQYDAAEHAHILSVDVSKIVGIP